MPIRTNRGRSAAYRALWSWPLRSPRRFTLTVVVVLGLVLAVGWAIPDARAPLPNADLAARSTTSPSSSPPAAPARRGVNPAPTATSDLPPLAPLSATPATTPSVEVGQPTTSTDTPVTSPPPVASPSPVASPPLSPSPVRAPASALVRAPAPALVQGRSSAESHPPAPRPMSARPPAVPSVRAAAQCADVALFVVPGSWEISPASNSALPVGMLAKVTNPLAMSYPSHRLRISYVPYPASVLAPVVYPESERQGVQNTVDMLRSYAAGCPASRYLLLGYSQGAAVAGDVVARIGQGGGPITADQLIGAGLVADPNRDPQLTPTLPAGVPGQGILPPRPGGFGHAAGKVVEVCAPGDPICDNSRTGLDLQAVAQAMQTGVHSSYPVLAVDDTGTTATAWLTATARKAVDSAPRGYSQPDLPAVTGSPTTSPPPSSQPPSFPPPSPASAAAPVTATPAKQPDPLPPGNWQLAWTDGFDGTTLDAASWATSSGSGHEGGGRLDYDQPGNVTVAGGMLTITARRENVTSPSGERYRWSSGLVTTGSLGGSDPPNRVAARPGDYLQMRARLPADLGMWPALSTWPEEVDAFEYYPDRPSVLELTNRTAGGGGGWPDLGLSISADWHYFGVYLGADATRWYLDGREIAHGGPFRSAGAAITVSLAVGDTASHPGPLAQLQQSQLLVDSVTIYRPAPPQPSGAVVLLPLTGLGLIPAGLLAWRRRRCLVRAGPHRK